MSEYPLHRVTDEWSKRAHIDEAKYNEWYQASIDDPDAFWGEHGKRIDWIKPYTKVKNTTYEYENVSIKWYEDGTLNVCANCVDRHLETRGDQTTKPWSGKYGVRKRVSGEPVQGNLANANHW